MSIALHQQKSVILPRLLGLRDHSPFILILDTIAQSSRYLEAELFHKIPKDANVIFLSYEIRRAHERANKVINCRDMSASAIHSAVKAAQKPQSKNVVFIDSLAYIEPEELTSFLVPLIGPNSSLIATYHTDIPSNPLKQKGSFYPSTVTLLSYFATAVLQVVPLPKEDVHEEEDRAAQVEQFVLPTKSCNKPVFQVHLSHRRKSGRSIHATYIVDYNMHEIRYVVPKKENEDTGIYGAEDQALLKGLTTFNLTTTDKQKAEREKVDLPFLQAQEVGQGGAQGGAIIYEFEKDDDYDEEDPYEDPF